MIKAVRRYYNAEVAKLRKALGTTDEEWLEMLQLGMEMRRALAVSCDGAHRCTCTICRAAWGWDHKYGALTRFNDPAHFDQGEINPHEPGWEGSTF